MFANRLRILIGKFEFPNEDEPIRFFDFNKIKKLVYNCGFRIIGFRYAVNILLLN